MFRQKSVVFALFAAVMLVAVACTSAEESTATPVPPTPTPTATPTPTPVPVELIDVDPFEDAAGFLDAVPASDVTCVTDALGGRDRVLAMLESALEFDPITTAEAELIDGCLSDQTVQAVFVGQLAREAGGVSDETVACIADNTTGMSAAALFTETPAVDSTISLLQGIFCLNSDEREAISASDAVYGFGDFGGIDALECVVNGVGPTGLEDLMGAASSGLDDFGVVADIYPLLVECGSIDDSTFEGTGISVDQVGCILDEMGESGLALLDPTAAESELGDLTAIFAALDTCGLSLEDLMGDATLQVDPAAIADPTVLPTVQIEAPEDISELELPFTEDQITCLTEEMGDEAIANLLEGGAPDLSLFTALTTCGVDPLSLLGP